MDTFVAMLACHRSQLFEWLTWLAGTLDLVPEQEEQRLLWLRQWYSAENRPRADRYRKELVAAYGQERGCQIESAKAFEISEYGSPLDASARQRLFAFFQSY
jgi:N-acetylglucosamine malate deacetylase 1